MAEAASARKRSAAALAAKEGASVAAKFDTSDEGNDLPGSRFKGKLSGSS